MPDTFDQSASRITTEQVIRFRSVLGYKINFTESINTKVNNYLSANSMRLTVINLAK